MVIDRYFGRRPRQFSLQGTPEQISFLRAPYRLGGGATYCHFAVHESKSAAADSGPDPIAYCTLPPAFAYLMRDLEPSDRWLVPSCPTCLGPRTAHGQFMPGERITIVCEKCVKTGLS